MRWATNDTVKAALAGALENLNGAVVLGGAVWLYIGIHGFSPHAADVVAGTILIAMGAFPYLRRTLHPKRKP